ncbi:MAG: hypothetical protein ACRECH_05065 [Nitrososphaerales archaeon]
MPLDELEDIHVQSLTGLGASYRMAGFFRLKSEGKAVKINFKGVAFGGHYGGHNVSVEISPRAKQKIMEFKRFQNDKAIDEVLTEVQRRLLNGEMVVEYKKLKPEGIDPLGNITM